METGEVMGTFTLIIITRHANEVMRQIHNHGDNKYRMSLFLPKELELKWLNPELTDLQIADLLSYEMPLENLDNWTLYAIRTSNPDPKNGSKIAFFEWYKLPPLSQDEIVKPQPLLIK